jgi:hypothetical protein
MGVRCEEVQELDHELLDAVMLRLSMMAIHDEVEFRRMFRGWKVCGSDAGASVCFCQGNGEFYI